MKVTVRKAPTPDPDGQPRVVVEVWMTREEAQAEIPWEPCTEATEDALREHLRTGYRVHRQVRPS